MRSAAIAILMRLLLVLPGAAQAATELAITHVTLIDGTRAVPRRDMTVVISGRRITAVGPAPQVVVPPRAVVVPGAGRFLVSGFYDMHVHLFNQVSRRPPNTWYFPLFIANGVTGIRDMWTKPEDVDQVDAWRAARETDSLLAPRIAAVGTIVDGPAGAAGPDVAALQLGPNVTVARTPEEARRLVRDLKAAGIDFVKTYSNLSRDVYLAIADEAKKDDIPFAGHVPLVIDAAEASSVGQRSMEHLLQILESSSSRSDELFRVPASEWSSEYEELMLDTFDEGRFRRLVAVLAKNRTWQVPTLAVLRAEAGRADPNALRSDDRLRYVPNSERADWEETLARSPAATAAETARTARLWHKQLEVVQRMHDGGVPFMTGTDVSNPYVFPGFSVHDEMELLVEAGFAPMQALQAATRDPAMFLGLSDSLGTVEEGKIADLVLLDADPTRNIHNTRKIRAVFVDGRYLDRARLNELLAEAEAFAKAH